MLPWASHCRRTRAGRAQDNCILIEQLYGVLLMNDWCELEKLFSTHAPSLVPLYWNPGTWVWERRIFFSLCRKSLTWERAVLVLISPLCPTSNAQIRSADHRSKPLIVVPWPLLRYLGHQVKLNRLPIHHESHDQSFCLFKNYVASL